MAAGGDICGGEGGGGGGGGDAAAAELSDAAADELEALGAIFGGAELAVAGRTVRARVAAGCELELVLHAGYPEAAAPAWLLRTPRFARPRLPPGVAGEDALRAQLDAALAALFVPGDPVLFAWIDAARDMLGPVYGELAAVGSRDDIDGDGDGDDGDGEEGAELPPETDKPVAAEPPADADADGFVMPPGCPPIVVSARPLVDRKSVFVAHAAAVTTPAEVDLVRRALLSNRRIARATHNIMAFRIVEPGGVVKQDCDDDGETAAGGRLLHLLQLADATNVVVVVSRWYGGVLLGPMRFKHINNVARELLEIHGFMRRAAEAHDAPAAAAASGSKRGKTRHR
ncbi:hypothetical protein HK105_207314 [Polyrhizophydium stewartii]|uniref:RWD domain-containing protein n=1 Tax=Polyrhizophydium stewartii TaxID=2732419 RepID=A0ABR4N123_9FUNG|nr:hypothetical protein HK105_002510 [Polyrhizophydium stewartii]